MIKALEKKGFKRWTNYGKDRLYIDLEELGLHCEYYKSGWESDCYLDGERISNCKAREIKKAAGKCYIDLQEGDTIVAGLRWVRERIADLVKEAEVEAEEAEPEITEDDIQSYEDVVKEGRDLEGDIEAYKVFYKKFYTEEDDDDDTWHKMQRKAKKLLSQKYPKEMDDLVSPDSALRQILQFESWWQFQCVQEKKKIF